MKELSKEPTFRYHGMFKTYAKIDASKLEMFQRIISKAES